jgi:hypothetical protein
VRSDFGIPVDGTSVRPRFSVRRGHIQRYCCRSRWNLAWNLKRFKKNSCLRMTRI